MSDEPTQAAEAAETTTETESAEQTPTADPRVLDRMEELAGQWQQAQPVLDQMGEFLQAQQQQEPQADPFEALVGRVSDGLADRYEEDQEGYVDPEALRDGFRQMVQRELQPLQQMLDRMQTNERNKALDSLTERYQSLQDPQTRMEFAEEVVSSAERFAGNLPPTLAANPEEVAVALMNDPNFAETILLAREARARAQSETPAGADSGAAVEAGGGASPGQAKTADEQGDEIVQAGNQSGWGKW